MSFLNGLPHEDFAVFGQFYSKVITCCLCTCTKLSFKTIGKISNAFCEGKLTKIIILVILKT